MSRNGQPAALLVPELAMAPGTAFERHAHPVHQLAWTDAGVLEVHTDAGVWVLPPTRALWIPAGLAHETRAEAASVLRGAYLDPAGEPRGWPHAQAVAVTPLLAALLLHLGTDLADGPQARAAALLGDLLIPVPATALSLTLPDDPRAADVARGLLDDPADPRTLAEWGRAVGAGPRTLSRGFQDGTGITFGRWRATARVRAALGRLAAGEPVAGVAPAVGYGTASAFVAAFRRQTGTTPGAYFAAGIAQDGSDAGRYSA